MVKVVTNGQGKVYTANGKALISPAASPVIQSLSVTPTTSAQTINASTIGIDGYSPVNVAAVTAAIDANILPQNIKKDVVILNTTGTYEGNGEFQLTRVKDDNNVEIGTFFMNFTNGNGQTYKVILLDAENRLANSSWLYPSGSVTNMPIYNNLKTSNVWEAKETATQNTQLIVNFCSIQEYSSQAVSHCRSKSFTIGGTTYYGQLPNITEVLEIAKHYNEFDTLDITSSNYTSTNFNSAREIWSSSQRSQSYSWYLNTNCNIDSATKPTGRLVCPVLEIPY